MTTLLALPDLAFKVAWFQGFCMTGNVLARLSPTQFLFKATINGKIVERRFRPARFSNTTFGSAAPSTPQACSLWLIKQHRFCLNQRSISDIPRKTGVC
jgi:hypothetical protein